MRSEKMLLLGLVAWAACAAPAAAALHDTGPMGSSSAGAPTPDASVLSKMHLPDQPTPLPGTPTAALTPSTGATAIQQSAARTMRFHPVWVRIQALADQWDSSPKKAELKALLVKYKLASEEDGKKLTPRQLRRLKADLDSLEKHADRAETAPSR